MNIDLVTVVHNVTIQILQQRALIAQLQKDCLKLKEEKKKLEDDMLMYEGKC